MFSLVLRLSWFLVMQYSLSGVMTRHDGLSNTYHTRYHSIGTCDMVEEDVSSRAGFIICPATLRKKGTEIVPLGVLFTCP